MKKKIVLGITICFFLVLQLVASDLVLINEIDLIDLDILQPQLMKVSSGFVYIWDKKSCEFFKLKDVKSICRFGKQGSGPGEIQKAITFSIVDNKLIVHDVLMRTLEFDLNGNYLDEQRLNTSTGFLNLFEKVNTESFISIEMKFGDKGAVEPTLFINYADKKKKLASTTLSMKKTLNLAEVDSFSYCYGKNHCYVLPSQYTYLVKQFDIKRQQFINTLEKSNCKKQRYSVQELEMLEKKLEKIKNSNPGLHKVTFEMPEFKPAIKDIVTDDMDNLYVVTSTSKNNQNLVEVYTVFFEQFNKFYINKPKAICIEKGRVFVIYEKEDSYYLGIYQIRTR